MNPSYFNARQVLAQRRLERALPPKTWIADVLGSWELPAVVLTAAQYQELQRMTPPSDRLEGVEGAMQ